MERIYTTQTLEKVGENVKLAGWAETVRNHGKIVFIMLQDIKSVIQCVGGEELQDVSEGYVIEIEGKVKERPEKMVNKGIETGTVEVEVTSCKILAKSKESPIPLNTTGYEINEEMRLKYRYLDLRRNRMRKIIKLRSEFAHVVRNEFVKHNFIEVETPMLAKATKEGARDFIVPSRYNPGKFYALPQSPQQYKQILMTAGVERYFQLARCVRDEDLRSDRGYEFTQIDLEMSFVNREMVMNTTESIIKAAVNAVGGKIKADPFPVIDYKDAMKKYGGDKFDLRTDKEKEEGVLAFAWVINFPFFKKVNKEDSAEVDDGKSGWVFTHNPFSRPTPEFEQQHLKGENPGEILTTQYDLVCNGYEVGGGSIRAHEPEMLRATYEIMGYSEQEIEDGIGHMLRAFELGTPPHGGIAFGLDRLVMLLANESSLKEVIAFPMTSKGSTAVMDAPSIVQQKDLAALHLDVTDKGDWAVKSIKAKLDNLEIKYDYLEHAEVRTSEEAAKVRNVPLEYGAKAMVLASKEYENKLAMVVIPGDKLLDLEKVKKALGEEFDVAPKELVEKRTGIKMGGVPPFGRLFGIEVYMDGSFWSKEKSAFNCGRRDASIIMNANDLIKAVQPNKISEGSSFTKE
ncbi:aspartate--tRNA ligase [bacterium]|nr:aspartate--tRNA ligase [bacterium]